MNMHKHLTTNIMQTSVIIGVGKIANRSSQVEEALEPRALILPTIQNAVRDTAVLLEHQRAIVNGIERIYVVNTWITIF